MEFDKHEKLIHFGISYLSKPEKFECIFLWSLNYTRLRTKEVIEQAQNIAMNYMIDEINKAFKKITKNNIDYLHDKINQYYGSI